MISNRQLFLRHVAQTSESSLQFEIQRAEGISFYDKAGKAYIDLVSGVSVSALGHGHPKVIEAVKDQADRYMHTWYTGSLYNRPRLHMRSGLQNACPEAWTMFIL